MYACNDARILLPSSQLNGLLGNSAISELFTVQQFLYDIKLMPQNGRNGSCSTPTCWESSLGQTSQGELEKRRSIFKRRSRCKSPTSVLSSWRNATGWKVTLAHRNIIGSALSTGSYSIVSRKKYHKVDFFFDRTSLSVMNCVMRSSRNWIGPFDYLKESLKRTVRGSNTCACTTKWCCHTDLVATLLLGCIPVWNALRHHRGRVMMQEVERLVRWPQNVQRLPCSEAVVGD